jgi:DNA-binding transcriptional MocR family regulator
MGNRRAMRRYVKQLQVKLAEIEIAAAPEQIVLTAGVTQALDLIARQFLRPGDAVLVDDPGWFLMFGMFAALGARPIGVPRQADGPDLAAYLSNSCRNTARRCTSSPRCCTTRPVHR